MTDVLNMLIIELLLHAKRLANHNRSPLHIKVFNVLYKKQLEVVSGWKMVIKY